MKINNETKVGILTIVALTILILGFNFLKGKNLFDKSKKIYAVFQDMGSLEKSNEVKINGLPIGSVFDKREIDKDVSAIIITINLTRDINIPDNSVAYIGSGLVGASFIIIEKGDSKTFLKLGDTLKTREVKGIMSEVTAQINPTLVKVRTVLDSLTQTIMGVNGLLNSDAKDNLRQTFANLNRASSALNGLLDNQTGALAKTLNNAETITEDFKKNSANISSTISNAKLASEKLAALELKPTIDSLNAMIRQLKSAVAKIASKDGTLGALINDKTLYNKLNDAILSAEILMDDLRTNPKRYVNLSIFGRKDKSGPITSPAIKDSIPGGEK
ncbi:MAG: MCE family protein [Chitinophagaceae bacterium]|nr:MCE family protein [Chitinophagaceae bacterium]MBK9463225.1 MCE family protein [Chitinophagaceae bacterium]MBK9659645.1 MCE family protein [Chitinophagaceae bacterium]MBK9936817.1 MCE family protein [Chitinophagaceae bacterium]MBP6233739.1 MCE family protein [Chitinophagaceae bacterium]